MKKIMKGILNLLKSNIGFVCCLFVFLLLFLPFQSIAMTIPAIVSPQCENIIIPMGEPFEIQILMSNSDGFNRPSMNFPMEFNGPNWRCELILGLAEVTSTFRTASRECNLASSLFGNCTQLWRKS